MGRYPHAAVVVAVVVSAMVVVDVASRIGRHSLTIPKPISDVAILPIVPMLRATILE